jgi:hypothetical protein
LCIDLFLFVVLIHFAGSQTQNQGTFVNDFDSWFFVF